MEEKNNDIDERNLEKKHSKIERAVSPEVPKKELKWNKEGESNCCGDYGSGSRLSWKKQKQSAQKLEKKGLKLYDMRALWQQSQDLGTSFTTNSQEGLGQPSKLQPNDDVLPNCLLSDVLWGGIPSLSKQQIFTN